jgi:drug/metabolite transporter (DMT)-like permease
MSHFTEDHRLRAIAALACAVFLWGSAFIGIRAVAASGAYSPGQLSEARLALASLVLGVLVLASGGIRVPERRDWIAFFALGLTGQMLYQLLLNTGERTVDGGTAALLVSCAPIVTALLAVTFLGERLTKLGWLGTAVAFTGAVTIAVSSGVSLAGGLGVLLIVAATLLWATYLVLQKTVAPRYSSLELTAWPMWIGAVLLLPFSRGTLHAVASAPPQATFAVVWLGVFSSVGGFLVWAYALKRLPVTVATSALYCVPVAAFVLGLALLRETPPTSALLGGVIAIVGVALVQLKGRPDGVGTAGLSTEESAVDAVFGTPEVIEG